MEQNQLKNNILGLQLPTDPRWIDVVSMNIIDILTDHAWCEQKAATTCISLIVWFGGEHPEIVEKLSPVVTEEWGHFRLVLRELKRRGHDLGPARIDEYVVKLMELCRTGGRREDRILDKLLISALIEARSCERFKILSENLTDPELIRFYHDLMVSEAGHYRLFLDLAKSVYGNEEKALLRWKEMLRLEAQIVSNLEIKEGKLH